MQKPAKDDVCGLCGQVQTPDRYLDEGAWIRLPVEGGAESICPDCVREIFEKLMTERH